jgi:hypothetical protein
VKATKTTPILLGLSAGLWALLCAATAQAGLVNAGFDTGSYPPWTESGENAVILNGPDIFESFSSTGGTAVSEAALEVFLGLAPGTLDGLGNGDVTEGSAIQQTFSLAPGESVSLLAAFLTAEATPDATFNDFAFLVVNGTVSELADTNSFFVPFNGTINGTAFNEVTPWISIFTSSISPPVIQITLALGVVDVGDTTVDSGLLVDTLEVNPPRVPEPGTWILVGGTGLAALAVTRRWRKT